MAANTPKPKPGKPAPAAEPLIELEDLSVNFGMLVITVSTCRKPRFCNPVEYLPCASK